MSSGAVQPGPRPMSWKWDVIPGEDASTHLPMNVLQLTVFHELGIFIGFWAVADAAVMLAQGREKLTLAKSGLYVAGPGMMLGDNGGQST